MQLICSPKVSSSSGSISINVGTFIPTWQEFKNYAMVEIGHLNSQLLTDISTSSLLWSRRCPKRHFIVPNSLSQNLVLEDDNSFPTHLIPDCSSFYCEICSIRATVWAAEANVVANRVVNAPLPLCVQRPWRHPSPGHLFFCGRARFLRCYYIIIQQSGVEPLYQAWQTRKCAVTHIRKNLPFS